MSGTTDVIQGTLDMLILKSLSLQPMHGFGVTQRIERWSMGARSRTLASGTPIFKSSQSSDISARSRKTRDEPVAKRVVILRHDDWNGRAGFSSRTRGC